MSEDSRYVLAKKIARGGMAEIFLGKHVGDDGFARICAIKRILPHYAQDQEFVQMFRDEAHICKRLQHANIVRVEGFEEVEGSFAIIMEFVDGCDLRSMLHTTEQTKKKLPIAMACHIVAEAARGLHFAHTKIDEITNQPLGIVHRDISPQNILVSYEGEVKVTDFGIADAENKLTETRPGIVKGKYSYMSPEQISAKDVDARTDVFALVIVLWEMLTMRRLFQGDNEVDTIQRVKNCRIDYELKALNPEVDDELEALVKKGLAKDLRKRHKSAGELEKDLRRFMSRKYPEFTPEDLGSYLKKTMEAKRNESQAEIKKTLTETANRPSTKAKSVGGPRKPGVDLAIEDNGPAPVLSVVRSNPTANHGNGGTGMGPMGSVGAVGSLGSTTGAVARPMTSNGPRPARLGPSTSIARPTARHTNASNAMPPSPSSGSNRIWLFTAMAVTVLVAGALGYRQLPGKQRTTAQLTIRSQPSRVRVTIDNVPVNQGRYLRASSAAPIVMKLKPGQHSLVVSRDGYLPYKYDFNLDSGGRINKDDIVLQERAPLAQVEIKIKPNDKPAKIDINDGYYVASFIPGKIDSVTPDVLVDKRYTMIVNLSGTDKDFSCSFTSKATTWKGRTVVTIDKKARKCTLAGP